MLCSVSGSRHKVGDVVTHYREDVVGVPAVPNRLPETIAIPGKPL